MESFDMDYGFQGLGEDPGRNSQGEMLSLETNKNFYVSSVVLGAQHMRRSWELSA